MTDPDAPTGAGAYFGGMTTWFAAIGMQTVMFPFLVTMELAAGPGALGIAMMSLMLPTLLLILIGGATADHFDGRSILVVTHLLAGLPALGLSAIYGTGALTYPVLIAYALCMGAVGAFIMPARDALLTRIADASSLQQAVMRASGLQFGAQILGFVVASQIEWVGITHLLLFQTALLWLGALLSFALPKGHREAGSAPSASAIFEGVKEVRRNERLFAPTVLIFCVGIFFFGTSQVAFPIIIRDSFGGGADELALSNGLMMSGIVAMTMILARRRRIERQGRAVSLALLFGCVCLAAFAVVPNFPSFVIVSFLWGMGGGVAMTTSRLIIQESAPAEYRARVLAAFQMGIMGGAPIGALLTGLLTEFVPPQPAMLIPAVLMASIVLLMAFLTPMGGIRALEPPSAG